MGLGNSSAMNSYPLLFRHFLPCELQAIFKIYTKRDLSYSSVRQDSQASIFGDMLIILALVRRLLSHFTLSKKIFLSYWDSLGPNRVNRTGLMLISNGEVVEF